MNIKNLIIYDKKIIFDILNEIKEELNCNLLFKSESDLLKTSNLENYLILSDHRIQNVTNQIVIDNFPLKINKLIEIINVNFLKKNFNVKSEVILGNYKINLNSRAMYNEKNNIDLTEKETLLILYLKDKNKPCSVIELQEAVWNQSSDLETHTVETHIYRLRKKIKDKFNDNNFLKSLKDGYSIN
jgi:DNA-binding response OmpR family regulator